MAGVVVSLETTFTYFFSLAVGPENKLGINFVSAFKMRKLLLQFLLILILMRHESCISQLKLYLKS